MSILKRIVSESYIPIFEWKWRESFSSETLRLLKLGIARCNLDSLHAT